MVPISAVVCLSLLALAEATNVRQCPGQTIENLSEKVQLSPCQKAPCILKKGTNQSISIRFTPEEGIDELTNHVTAEVFGVDLPFIGVDGASVCDKIYTTDDKKASCPLQAGIEYIYKDEFAVLAIYPQIATKVKWALVHKNKDMTCFEVRAKIQ